MRKPLTDHPRFRLALLTALAVGWLLVWPNLEWAASAPNAITGESSSGQGNKSTAPPTSIIELLQRLLQEHEELRDVRSERAGLAGDLSQAQAEYDDVSARLQSTPATLKSGEPNSKREPLDRRAAVLQSKLNIGNAKLSRLDDRIDDLSSGRNATAMALLRRLVIFLIVAFVVWILARLLMRIPERVVKQEQDRFYIKKLIRYSGRLIVILVFLYTVFGELGSFSAFLGLTGAGIAIALQDVIVSFVAWFFIIGRRGLSIGDRIEVSNVKGDVVDIGVLRIVIQEVGNWLSNDVPTGRRVFIPNSFVFKNYYFNYTKPQPFINDEIKLTFTYESDWEKAAHLVKETAQQVMRDSIGGKEQLVPQDDTFSHWGVGMDESFPEVFTRIADSGVEVRLVYFTGVRDRNKMRDAMNRAVLKAVRNLPDLSLAYPTSRAISTPPGVKP